MQQPENKMPSSSSPRKISIRLRGKSQSPPPGTTLEIRPPTLKEIIDGVKRNEIILTAEVVKDIPKSELSKPCVGELNLLDLAIMTHNLANIQFLVPNYFHPHACKTNCLIQLFRVKRNLDKDNITKITEFLIKQGCAIPDEKDLEQKGSPCSNPVICMGDYFAEARKIIDAERNNIDQARQETSSSPPEGDKIYPIK